MCCSVVQCGVVCCSVRVAMCFFSCCLVKVGVLWCDAVSCVSLSAQKDASVVYGHGLYVAVCFSVSAALCVLQCVE